jgi:hypothetical protein
MNFFGFQSKLYVFGGSFSSGKTVYNDFHVFDLRTMSWKELNTSNEQQLFAPTIWASTTIVPSFRRTNPKCHSVYVIGGSDGGNQYHKKIMKIELEGGNKFWLPHFLRVTGFSHLISLNLCDDLIQMYHEKNIDY